MEYTPHYIRMVYKAEGERAKTIQRVHARMAQIDAEIQRNHWDTQNAIAEMYGDYWAGREGFVNEATGQIETMDAGDVVRNSRGQAVSRSDIERGLTPDQATVLREAGANDYMRGVYDRVHFRNW
jgi:hypothetical protein